MLEIKNLVKVYRPKKGVPVTALNGVSLSFPDKGMVFLLGKSGCGKSTLLNVLGGLDSFDEGEFLVAGVSTKDFRSAKIDSYRNTMVGFIFQEYNVLEEFTVGANIALALQLQGKKTDGATIEAILDKVGLAGYANRRPNELSGGQKQRVAIARALVKDPKIIMADEPTGALDSATGKQVLDTLKELSREKLVIVVSHDREFALKYADRIIELSDGKVISDQEYETDETAQSSIMVENDQVFVPAGYELTEEDRKQINEYLRQMEKGGSLAFVSGMKRVAKKTAEIVNRVYEPLKLIRSSLPLKAAFPIGVGALKHKKIRLAFTIFLSFIAFGLFGLTDTLGAYDHITTCVNSIMDSDISYASVARAVKREGDIEDSYITSGRISTEELQNIREDSGVPMVGVYLPDGEELRFHSYFDSDAEFSETEFRIHANSFNGFAEVSKENFEKMGLSLAAGRLPDGTKNEIAISSYVCETFYVGGFAVDGEEKQSYDKITAPEDMIGRTMVLGENEYTVVGVFNFDLDLERYKALTERNEEDGTAQMILDYALYEELNSIQNYSLAQVALVGEGRLSGMIAEQSKFLPVEQGYMDASFMITDPNGESYYMGVYCGLTGDVEHAEGYSIAWVNGEKEALGEKEIVVNLADLIYYVNFEYNPETAYDPMTGELDFARLTDKEKEDFLRGVGEIGPITLNVYSYFGEIRTVEDVRIVGVLLPKEGENLESVREIVLAQKELISEVVVDNGGVYRYAVGNMPESKADVEKLVRFTNREDTDVRFELQNSVTFELNGIHEVLNVLGQVFFYVGIGFAVFAALMLSNFIGTSISYRRQEIGILRAIGARSNDVFRIFFCESFVIAMINFVLATAFSFAGATLINTVIRSETAILITPLTFSVRQVLLIFGVSVLVAFVASFLPVRKIAAKKPVDAIRGK